MIHYIDQKVKMKRVTNDGNAYELSIHISNTITNRTLQTESILTSETTIIRTNTILLTS